MECEVVVRRDGLVVVLTNLRPFHQIGGVAVSIDDDEDVEEDDGGP